jgi:mono/diheme cytochrome c family protein
MKPVRRLLWHHKTMHWSLLRASQQLMPLRHSRLAVQGLRLARAQCAECHLLEKGSGLSPNAAAPTFEDIANIQGMTSAAFTAALRTSHETKPNVIIKGRDISDLVAYVLSIKDWTPPRRAANKDLPLLGKKEFGLPTRL